MSFNNNFGHPQLPRWHIGDCFMKGDYENCIPQRVDYGFELTLTEPNGDIKRSVPLDMLKYAQDAQTFQRAMYPK